MMKYYSLIDTVFWLHRRQLVSYTKGVKTLKRLLVILGRRSYGTMPINCKPTTLALDIREMRGTYEVASAAMRALESAVA